MSSIDDTIRSNMGLKVEGIGKSYNNRSILRDVHMELHTGEVVGLFGPNGAGKTSCFYMVSGMIPPDYGKITLNGVDITTLPIHLRSRAGIGYLPQESSIFRGLSVEQNILAVLEAVESDVSLHTDIVDSLLNEFTIEHLRAAPAIALSGGERRRLEIARALATNPQYILLDEPLAGVDPVSVLEIGTLIKYLKERDIGVLITDHNVRETLGIVDRAYILHDGKMLISGTVDEIVNDETTKRVYLGNNFSL